MSSRLACNPQTVTYFQPTLIGNRYLIILCSDLSYALSCQLLHRSHENSATTTASLSEVTTSHFPGGKLLSSLPRLCSAECVAHSQGVPSTDCTCSAHYIPHFKGNDCSKLKMTHDLFLNSSEFYQKYNLWLFVTRSCSQERMGNN